MVLSLDPKLESALVEQANRQGIPPEQLAIEVLRERLLTRHLPEPKDEWERDLLAAARPWGVSLPDSALTSEEMYD